MPSPSWYKNRKYLHFDRPVGVKRSEQLVTDKEFVLKHSFYPFIGHTVTIKKIKVDEKNGEIIRTYKPRTIRYSAHLDSQIYSYYANTLNLAYEERIKSIGISDSVTAFRPLGKCNIDFANEAFDEITTRGKCVAIVIDITKFFDTLNHNNLKSTWAQIISEDSLPTDHYKVFKSITKYSSVERDSLYKTLGIPKTNPKNGRNRVCSPSEFRNIVRANELITKNEDIRGIPQGSPISAILSNVYMINFDEKILKFVQGIGGKYYRYCDDMLFVVPTDKKDEVIETVTQEVENIDLSINPDKTKIHEFVMVGKALTSEKPLQYLGFTFDGQRKLIRSAALARYSERMKRGVRLAKKTMNKHNEIRKENGKEELSLFKRKLYDRYSHLGKRNFIRYGIRSVDIMKSKSIKKQLKPLWRRLQEEIDK